jgi:hypothetical protein
MLKKGKVLICIAALLIAALSALPLQADLLSYSGSAYNDGITTWAGTSGYVDGPLNGTIEYSVYAPDVFNTLFPGSGYTAPLNDFTYAYQIIQAGQSDLSKLDVSIAANRPSDTIGTFSTNLVSGDVPLTSVLTAPKTANYIAEWTFGGILTPNSSQGLVFSSPNSPEMRFGSVVNSGLNAFGYLPSPSTVPGPVPEPSSLLLLACGAFIITSYKVYRRR